MYAASQDAPRRLQNAPRCLQDTPRQPRTFPALIFIDFGTQLDGSWSLIWWILDFNLVDFNFKTFKSYLYIYIYIYLTDEYLFLFL